MTTKDFGNIVIDARKQREAENREADRMRKLEKAIEEEKKAIVARCHNTLLDIFGDQKLHMRRSGMARIELKGERIELNAEGSFANASAAVLYLVEHFDHSIHVCIGGQEQLEVATIDDMLCRFVDKICSLLADEELAAVAARMERKIAEEKKLPKIVPSPTAIVSPVHYELAELCRNYGAENLQNGLGEEEASVMASMQTIIANMEEADVIAQKQYLQEHLEIYRRTGDHVEYGGWSPFYSDDGVFLLVTVELDEPIRLASMLDKSFEPIQTDVLFLRYYRHAHIMYIFADAGSDACICRTQFPAGGHGALQKFLREHYAIETNAPH